MRNTIEVLAAGYLFYRSRQRTEQPEKPINFRVTPTPLQLSKAQKEELTRIGHSTTQYFLAVQELSQREEEVAQVLSKGKPEIFANGNNLCYLFIRPDIIMTADGMSICEIETSPFGLGLAHLLTQAYSLAGFETMAGPHELVNHVHRQSANQGTMVYSDKIQAFRGQLQFLVDHVFSGLERSWVLQHVQNHQDSLSLENLYRAFYLGEYLTDQLVKTLIDNTIAAQINITPSLTPHVEEKAILALIWDKRWSDFFNQQLGRSTCQHLLRVIPPTWVVGQERYFIPGLPNNVATTAEVAGLHRVERELVLKPSGFSPASSWSLGVAFLHEKSQAKAKALLVQAEQDRNAAHVVQKFTRGTKIALLYEDNKGTKLEQMQARIRLTPYYALDGSLLTVKATGCEKTDYVHASSASINTAVA